VVVCGPTASGKTRLAIHIAGCMAGEIVCADSMQVYRHMRVGTAKPTEEERARAPHHLVDFLEPGEEFSVARYAELARAAIADIHRRGRLPLVAGGTGLYIQAVTDNIRFQPISSDPRLRQELESLAEEQGGGALLELLREADPALAQRLHPNNRGRIIRALEVYRLTGVPLSRWQERSRLETAPYALCMLGIGFRDRQALYRRIDRRVDEMLDQGLVDEAGELFAGDFGKTASQAIGYKELLPYLRGECPLEQAVEQVKLKTRQYAKRQLTWLRRDERIHWLWADEADWDALCAQALKVVAQSLDKNTYA